MIIKCDVVVCFLCYTHLLCVIFCGLKIALVFRWRMSNLRCDMFGLAKDHKVEQEHISFWGWHFWNKEILPTKSKSLMSKLKFIIGTVDVDGCRIVFSCLGGWRGVIYIFIKKLVLNNFIIKFVLNILLFASTTK